VAVGDVACATPPSDGPECHYDAVGDLVTGLDPDRFLLLGDAQYPDDGPPDFAPYDAAFGALKDRTYAVLGDEDLEWPRPFFAYFDSVPRQAYYSFDVGTWHVIALNSRDCFDDDGCDEGSDQYEWLRSDLSTHAEDLFPCTLAFFHDPRFLWAPWWRADDGPGPGGPLPEVEPFWRLLYEGNADVILDGNVHNYERWAPQDPDGVLDPAHGIVEFVVGTGGRSLNPRGREPMPAHLAAFQSSVYGALELTLGDGAWDFAYHVAAGEPAFTDAGTGVPCH
jgi:hypothetical protein